MTAGSNVSERPSTSVPGPSEGPVVDVGAGTVQGRAGRRIPWMRIGWILGVLLPLAVMVRFAMIGAPTFDGAMNLQVANNLSHGLGFVRQYGGTTFFPTEVQTSGAYIFLAAGLIKIFGAKSFVYEVPNLIFVALLLVAVSLALRRWPVIRIIGPSVVLFAVPGMLDNAIHGYGEYVVAALVASAFVLLGAAATGMRRPALAAAAASVLIGIAFTVKVIALLAYRC